MSDERIENDPSTKVDVEKADLVEAGSIAENEEMASGTDANFAELSRERLLELLAEAEDKAAEYLDGWQRARAEFANARKRLERDRIEAYGNAAIDYAKKLLPIFDDFDRALANVPPTIESEIWFDGLYLVRRKLQSILSDLEVEPIEAVGSAFDPRFHEALSLMEVEGVDGGVVIEELQTGYRLGDRVIRPSLVNVAA